jgi:hypothetical protein
MVHGFDKLSLQDHNLIQVPALQNPMQAASEGRTYTWQRGLFQTAQLLLIATLAYRLFDALLNPDIGENIRDVCLVGVIGMLIASTGREVLYCSRRFKVKKEGILNPFILLVAATIGGAIATQVAYSQAKKTTDAFERKILERNKTYLQSLTTCTNDVIIQAETFTNPPCVPCHYILERAKPPLDQSVIQEVNKYFDKIICVNLENQQHWPNLVDVQNNETKGAWPCKQTLFPKNEPWQNNVTIAYAYFLGVFPPSVFNVAMVNASCKHITGFGTEIFGLTDLCSILLNNPDIISLYDFNRMPCIHPTFVAYMNEYVDQIREDSTTAREPSDAYETLRSTPIVEMWATIPLSILTAFSYEFIKQQVKRRIHT